MKSVSPSSRLPPRTTEYLALGIFLLLFFLLLLFAFSFRVAPVNSNHPDDGTLPAWVAVFAAAFTAGGAASLTSLTIANRRRLHSVMRPRLGKILTAILLGAIAPVAFFNWNPVVPGVMVVSTLLDYNEIWISWVFGSLALSFLTYPIAALVISGVRPKLMRLATFTLVWWSAYFGQLLIFGFQSSGL